MPYELKQNVGKCAWAVVKQGTDQVVGCHPSKAKARAHLAALYIHVDDALRMSFADVQIFANPYHDAQGRFAHAPMTAAQKATVTAEESRIAQHRDREEAVCVAPDGSVVFRYEAGNAREVTIPLTDLWSVEGNVLTHNHPSGWNENERSGAESFSPDDVIVGARNGMHRQ